MSESQRDQGLEVIVEPGVVPKGTFDLRSLDASPGAVPPRRRVEPDGRVFALAGMNPDSAATTIVVRTPVATPAVETPSAVANQEALNLDASETGAIDIGKDKLAAAGRRSPRRPIRENAESVIPPRPASADKGSSRVPAGALLPEDDHETAQISGGFASGLVTLFKVTLVLSAFTLLSICTYLYWNDLLPWSPQPAVANGKKPLDTGTPPPPKPIEKPTLEIKPEVASVPTESVASVATTSTPEVAKRDPIGEKEFPPVTPEAVKPEVKKPEAPSAEGAVEQEADYDVHRVEQLRAEAVNLYLQGRAAKTPAEAAKKFDESLRKLEELLALKPKDSDALFRKGNNLHAKGEFAEAAKAYQAAAALSSSDARPWNNLGLIREAQRDYRAARAAYEKGLTCDSRNADVLTNLGRLEINSDPKAALVHFDKAIERDERYVYPRYNRAVLLALKLNRADEAKKELEKIAGEESPLRADSLQMLGDVALSTGQISEAEGFYQRALAANPELDGARLSLGVAFYTRGDNEKAEKELNLYLKKHPKSSEGWHTLGAALARLVRLKEAKSAYERALAEDDKDAELHYDYALCAERFGNFNFAIPEYERVLKIDAKHWKALSNLARLYHVAGRDTTALDLVDKSIAIQPGWANSHLLRGNVLVALGRKAEARAALEQFLKMATPGDKKIDDVRKALETSSELVSLPDAPRPDGAPK
ncbi:tetratricopeptide repeat protein [bacterium]|nr:tetratricopeptide repeat protein [bacterium]